jgi:hypothetical protein
MQVQLYAGEGATVRIVAEDVVPDEVLLNATCRHHAAGAV